jgi:hypothetical protein
VFWVAERTEIIGVAAMRVPIFRLNGEGVNAVDGYFHGWDLWAEFTGLKGQSGDAIVTAIGRNYVNGAEGINLNDGANLAVDRDGLADGRFRGIHVLFLLVELTEREGDCER